MTTTIHNLAAELDLAPAQLETHIARLLERIGAEQGVRLTFADIEDPSANLDLDDDDMAITDDWVPAIRDEAIGLGAAVRARRALDDAEDELVRTISNARDRGATWQQLADALGWRSRQAIFDWFSARTAG